MMPRATSYHAPMCLCVSCMRVGRVHSASVSKLYTAHLVGAKERYPTCEDSPVCVFYFELLLSSCSFGFYSGLTSLLSYFSQ